MFEFGKTWADLEVAASRDPYLHAAVTLVRQGMGREEALIAAAIAMSQSLASYRSHAASVMGACICGAAFGLIPTVEK